MASPRARRLLLGIVAALVTAAGWSYLASKLWPLLPYHALDFVSARLHRHAGIHAEPYFGLLHVPAQGAGHEERGRQRVDCRDVPRGPRTAVLLIFGQSNAANHGERAFAPRDGVYNLNFYTGRCFAARDPLLGATAAGGSLGAPLGDLLVKDGVYDAVLLVPIAVGAATVEDWAPSGHLHRRLAAALDRTRDAGFAPTFVIWHQGESNTRWNADPVLYGTLFRDIVASIRARGVDAPVFAALASICLAGADRLTRAGQAALPDAALGIHPGPDTDTLGMALRFDSCHFSAEGMTQHARLWAETLRRYREAAPGRLYPRVTAATIGAGPPEPEQHLVHEPTPGRARARLAALHPVAATLAPGPQPAALARAPDLLRLSYVVARPGARVAVRVRLSATATARNELVAAVFRADLPAPVMLYRLDLEPGRRADLDREVEIEGPRDQTPLELVLRVGLARADGEVFLNGTRAGRDPRMPPATLDASQAD